MLNDRIYIGARYYEKITHGLLADIILPPSTGFISYKENLGDMKNTGAELNIKGTVYRNRDLTVNLTANMARNKEHNTENFQRTKSIQRQSRPGANKG